MKLYEAKNIITEVFEYPFDKDKFNYFIRNLLKNLHPAEFLRTGYNIPKAFEDFIASYERLGKYEDEEGNLIDVLIVKLKRDHSIDYARSTQRNFVRWYLNDKGKDAALVAFHTEKSSEWRFSFIKMQYSLEKKKDELTPAKRSSFMVGESGKSHTAQRQLIDLLKNDHAPYLSDIEDAFSIEAVSDEFYEKYKALLFNLVDEVENIVKKDKTVKEEFESKNISILNFSKKLLGQIVFLYFLQKKGWLGLEEKEKYGEGDKNFLRSLFNKTKQGENFFNDYLEYLFYDALSKKRVTDYYDRFKTRIPFLNGGLFDPIEFYDWEKTDIVIPNKIFSDRKGDEEGNGILDVFDLYNFTVKEDEPLETEVAIDPEMLGKVFERMLDVTERKSKGAFYTPREIVHYMAQQSLLYFLETELQKESVRKEDLETFIHYGEHIIDKDIAIEEGKLSQTANKQTIAVGIRQNAEAIDAALENIKICDPAVGSGAFPVGIMNEIVKLRKLLTPFLKKESTDERSAYYFKSNAIQNSIYGVDIDAGAVEIAKLRLWLSMVVDEQSIQIVEPLPNLEYKIVKGDSLINIPDGTAINDELSKKIESLIKSYYHITDKQKKQEQKQIIDEKIQEQLKFVSDFTGYDIDFDFKLFFHEVFHEKRGFDIVIGNPPYITPALGKKQNIFSEEYIKILKKLYKDVFEYKGNTYSFFIKKTPELLNETGSLNYIIPNTLLLSSTFSKTRKLLINNTVINILMNFLHSVFDQAETGGNLILHASLNTNSLKSYKIKTVEFNSLFDFNKYWEFSLIDYKYIRNSHLNKIYLDSVIYKTLAQISTNKKSLGEIVKFYQGIITGDNKKFISNKKLNSNYKKILRGKDISRYNYSFSENYVLFDKNKLWSNTNEQYFLTTEKLINRQTGDRLVAAYDNNQFFTLDSTHVQTLIDKNFSIKFILSIFNSSTLNYYYNLLVNEGGRTFAQVKTVNLKQLPIPRTPLILQKVFITIVDYIILLKSQRGENMSYYFEQLIDGMVYELYFENEIKQAGCDILKHLNGLPELNNEMDDDEKLKIITKVFNKLYDKESPVRKNLFFMDSVEKVAIIKKSLEK